MHAEQRSAELVVQQVLRVMRRTGHGGGFVAGTHRHPHANDSGMRTRQLLGHHAQPGGQHATSKHCAVAVLPCGHVLAGSSMTASPLEAATVSSSDTGTRLILPRLSMSATSTRSLSPTLTTSSTLPMRLPLPSLEMCTKPSLPGTSETKAPKAAVFTTVPRNRSPTLGSCGLAIALIRSMAASADGPSLAPT